MRSKAVGGGRFTTDGPRLLTIAEPPSRRDSVMQPAGGGGRLWTRLHADLERTGGVVDDLPKLSRNTPPDRTITADVAIVGGGTP